MLTTKNLMGFVYRTIFQRIFTMIVSLLMTYARNKKPIKRFTYSIKYLITEPMALIPTSSKYKQPLLVLK